MKKIIYSFNENFSSSEAVENLASLYNEEKITANNFDATNNIKSKNIEATNNIKANNEINSKKFIGDELKTDKLCIGKTCMTEKDLSKFIKSSRFKILNNKDGGIVNIDNNVIIIAVFAKKTGPRQLNYGIDNVDLSNYENLEVKWKITHYADDDQSIVAFGASNNLNDLKSRVLGKLNNSSKFVRTRNFGNKNEKATIDVSNLGKNSKFTINVQCSSGGDRGTFVHIYEIYGIQNNGKRTYFFP